MRHETASFIKSALEKTILHLALILVFFPPLFLVPRVFTHDVTLHTKLLFTGFVSSLAAGLCIVRIMLFSDRISFKDTPVRLAVIIYGISIIISCILSEQPLYSLRESLRIIPFLLIFIFFPRNILTRDAVKIRITALLAGFLTAFYGLCQYFDYNFLLRWFPFIPRYDTARSQIVSTMGNPEYLGSYLSPLVILCIPAFLKKSRPAIQIIYAMLIAILLFTILLTGSRGPVIGMAAGGLFAAIFIFRKAPYKVRKRITVTCSILFLIMLIFIVIFSFPNRLNPRGQNISGRFVSLFDIRSESIKERIMFYVIGSEMISDNPVFGSGEGMFRVKFYPTLNRLLEKDDRAGVRMFIKELKNRVADNSHNDFLQIWIENGIIGFLAFTLAIFMFLGRSIFYLKNKSDISKNHGCEVLAYSSALLCVLVNATFSFPLHMPARSALFWVLFSVSCSMILTTRPNK